MTAENPGWAERAIKSLFPTDQDALGRARTSAQTHADRIAQLAERPQCEIDQVLGITSGNPHPVQPEGRLVQTPLPVPANPMS